MEIPLILGNKTDDGIIDPKDKVELRLRLKNMRLVLPDNVILSFYKDLEEVIKTRFNTTEFSYTSELKLFLFEYKGKKFAYLFPTMGSYASVVLEEMIALGGKRFIFIGSVGTTAEIKRGVILLPSKAIRDEGVSYAYLPPEYFSFPDQKLFQRLKSKVIDSGREYKEGTCWTVSTPFRETRQKLSLFIDQGTICVDMEAASLFAVAEYRHIPIAGVFL